MPWWAFCSLRTRPNGYILLQYAVFIALFSDDGCYDCMKAINGFLPPLHPTNQKLRSPPHCIFLRGRTAPFARYDILFPRFVTSFSPTEDRLAIPDMSKQEDAPVGVPNSASAMPPPKPDAPKLDPAYYTWSSTFNILMGRMTGNRDVLLEQKYFEEMDAIKAESYCKRCESNRDYLLQYSPVVKFMKDEVAKLGGDLNEKNIQCRVCTTEQSGGFHVDHGIMLCANKFRNRGHQEDTMAHEMVHAWDYLKWKVDDNNLRHQACLEVWPLPVLIRVFFRALIVHPLLTLTFDKVAKAEESNRDAFVVHHQSLNSTFALLQSLTNRDIDPSLHTLRRMPLYARVLHQEPMAGNRTTPALRAATRNALDDGSTWSKRRCARCPGRQRSLGQLLQRHKTVRRDLPLMEWKNVEEIVV